MRNRYALLIPVALALTAPAAAQEPVPGSCELGNAQADLNVSDVQARLFNTGSLFFGNSSQAAYLVPRMAQKSPMFAAGLWVGGLIGGEVRVAGATYADFEFWPGPIDPATGRPPNPDDCSGYDRIYVVSVRDVEDYDATGVASPDLAEWPVGLGAEVVDGDGVPGNYNLAGGDRPRIFGTQTAFWVMNDMGNAHQNSLTPPIGLEVRVHAFAIVSADAALNQSTVYRYTLANRNSQALEAARFSVFADPDLGDAADDYVGVDIARGLGIVYNADNQDGPGSGGTYGTSPPAAGFDLLSDGLGAFMYFVGSAPLPQQDPANGEQIYQVQQGRWTDGTPMTVGGTGLNPGSTNVTTFAFPGDPVVSAFWSERCPLSPSCGSPTSPGDRRMVISSPSFTLGAGESRTFDVALVFGQGSDNNNSVTVLRAASDVIQSGYATESLFDSVPPLGSLPAPALIAPSEGQFVGGGPVTLAWEEVPGAEGYVVDVWAVADTAGRALSPSAGTSYFTGAVSIEVPGCNSRPNYLATCAWRVRADAPSAGAVGHYSETRTFRMQEFVAGLLDGGGSVVETSNPAQAPCPDPGDFGCDTYAGEGNTVFRDPNRTGDYDVSSTTGRDLGLHNTTVPGAGFARTASPFDYEIRFTLAGGYGVYNAFLGAASPKRVVRVPFEVWNVGTTPEDPSDDVRMIPVLRQPAFVPTDSMVTDWRDSFPRSELRVESGDTLSIPVTEQLAALFPDRPNGYDLFEAAAIGFGGAGAIYDPAADGDTQIDTNPATGTPCSRQGYYIGFCARNDQYVPPGGNSLFSAAFVQLLFTDLAGDGTTPPVGTVVRLKMARFAPVANEPPAGPGNDDGVVIESITPNPVTGAARIAYSLSSVGAARVVVYDVLGREVAVLADGPAPAGRREVRLDADRFAPGVYVIAIQTRTGRASRTFTVRR